MKQHLEKAFELIASIRVSGDDQERAVAAKNALRAAFAELEQQEKTQLHEFDPKKSE